MRVISGFLKGKKIEGYNIEGTRPTMDRVKESIFGSIQNYVPNSVILDLFAGSGNLGIEAISNGAKYSYFVDNNKIAYNTLISNINNLNIKDKCNTMLCDYKKALKYYKKNNIKFDIIFIDPPYKYNIIEEIINKIEEYNLLNNNGIIVLEFQNNNISDTYNSYKLIKKKKYGDKFVYILKKIID